MTPSPAELRPQDADAIRDAIREAVLGVPVGLRGALETDAAAYLALVAASRTAAQETSRLLHESVAGARAAGHSWDTLGRLLGVSRQAAQQRFAPAGSGAQTTAFSVGTPGDAGAPARQVLTPLTAFTEMAVLEDYGRRGWQVVDYGPLFHVVEQSDVPWEHRRFSWAPRQEARRNAEGWTLIRGATFPWGYYKRPLDGPVADV